MGPSRSLEMSPFDRAHIPIAFYSNYGSISCRFWDIQCEKISWPNSCMPYVTYSFLLCNSNFVFKTRRFYDIRLKNVVTLKSGSEVTQDHWKWYHSVDRVWFPISVVPKAHRFWDIRLVSIQWPWNPGKGSLKVIESYTIQSGTHDFLLTFHSNHRPITHRFRDKRRFPSKIARKSPIFPTPCVFNAPAEGALGIGYRLRGLKKLEWWGYQKVEKVLR